MIQAALFALTVFSSAFFLFMVQPWSGRILLPMLGGASQVWITAMVFFQGLLLFGYLAAHLLTRLRTGWLTVLLVAAILALPVLAGTGTIPGFLARGGGQEQLGPVLWELLVLFALCGPAFFALSILSPWIGHLFARHRGAAVNPYVLYAASNAGSFAALLAYPLVIEPWLSLQDQRGLFEAGYGVVAGAVTVITWMVVRRDRPDPVVRDDGAAPHDEEDLDDAVHWNLTGAEVAALPEGGAPVQGFQASESIEEWLGLSGTMIGPEWKNRMAWLVLAFIPSCLMLGVTSYMTTDIAAIPLLWVLPLAIYMLSFVIVFLRYEVRADRMMARLAPWVLGGLTFLLAAGIMKNYVLILGAHVGAFFFISIMFHGRLSLLRPQSERLTEYYICIAAGGVAGGVFNGLMAPTLFSSIAEYPAGILAALLVSQVVPIREFCRTHMRILAGLLVSVALVGLYVGMHWFFQSGTLETPISAMAPVLDREAARKILVYGLPVVLCLLVFVRSTALQAFALAGVLVAILVQDWDGNLLYRDRSFYGVLTVRSYEDPPSHSLVHGGILHGEQWTGSAEDRLVPRSYYHPDGPIGEVIRVVTEQVQNPHIAVIGLGSGALAAYGQPDNRMTFYEIDPHVVEIASNPRYFSYVDDCKRRWCNLSIVTGDGRIRIGESTETYDLIVIDAFASDSIPVHLLTREAIETYLGRLSASGILAFHISNRYVDLEPVLLAAATELDLGYAMKWADGDETIGKGGSSWAILARNYGLYEHIIAENSDNAGETDNGWRGLNEREGVRLWTDDYANVIRTFTWY